LQYQDYKDTGFVRSLGYSGFDYGDPGFLLWSGSALSGSVLELKAEYHIVVLA
jgi:hypothetical protein